MCFFTYSLTEITKKYIFNKDKIKSSVLAWSPSCSKNRIGLKIFELNLVLYFSVRLRLNCNIDLYQPHYACKQGNFWLTSVPSKKIFSLSYVCVSFSNGSVGQVQNQYGIRGKRTLRKSRTHAITNRNRKDYSIQTQNIRLNR